MKVMNKIKTSLLILFSLSCFGGWAQNMPLGMTISGLGLNFCSYSTSSTNLCTLDKITGSLSGTNVNASYSYAVLYKFLITGKIDYTAYTGGIGSFDFTAGGEYHVSYFGHKKPPVDIYLDFNFGYTHLNVESNSVSSTGIFNASGICAGFGAILCKYFSNNIGIFIDANFDVHHYNGGEVAVPDEGKNPYSLTLSGFNYGFGLCKRFGSKVHPLID